MFANGKLTKEKETLYLQNRRIRSFSGNSQIVLVIYLHNNNLSSFLAEEGAFPKLKELYLSDNRLTLFVAEEGVFPNLADLFLSRNRLTLFSSTREAFPNLMYLGLGSNQLTSFSAEKGAFPNLIILHLDENQLVSFSAEDKAFPNLRTLYLQWNQLASVAAEKGAFPKLKQIELSHNPNLEALEIMAPNIEELWLCNTKIHFLDETLLEKVKGRDDIQAHYHHPETKRLVIESFHQGNPIVSEIIEHLTR